MDTAHEVVTTISDRYKLSDVDIARLTESTQPTIWRLRSGKTKDCSADLYRRLCGLRDEMQKAADATDCPVTKEAV